MELVSINVPVRVGLRALLEHHKVSQSQICRRLGINRSYLNQVLSGRRFPSRHLVHAMSLFCGWKRNELEWALALLSRENFSRSLNDVIVRSDLRDTGLHPRFLTEGVEGTLDLLAKREISDGTFCLSEFERNLSKILISVRRQVQSILTDGSATDVYSAEDMAVHATYPMNYFSLDAMQVEDKDAIDGGRDKFIDEVAHHVSNSLRQGEYYSPEVQHSIHLLGRLGEASLVPTGAECSQDIFIRRAVIASRAQQSKDIEYYDWIGRQMDESQDLRNAFVAIELAYFGAIDPPAIKTDISNARDPQKVIGFLAGTVARRPDSVWGLVCSRLAVEIAGEFGLSNVAVSHLKRIGASISASQANTKQAEEMMARLDCVIRPE